MKRCDVDLRSYLVLLCKLPSQVNLVLYFFAILQLYTPQAPTPHNRTLCVVPNCDWRDVNYSWLNYQLKDARLYLFVFVFPPLVVAVAVLERRTPQESPPPLYLSPRTEPEPKSQYFEASHTLDQTEQSRSFRRGVDRRTTRLSRSTSCHGSVALLARALS